MLPNDPVLRDMLSEIERIEKKEVSFCIWQGDALERIRELEQNLDQCDTERKELRASMRMLAHALHHAHMYAVAESSEICAETFARDFAPFKNIMAHYGDKEYAKKGRKA